jgi:hypothetical protein
MHTGTILSLGGLDSTSKMFVLRTLFLSLTPSHNLNIDLRVSKLYRILGTRSNIVSFSRLGPRKQGMDVVAQAYSR